MKVLMVLTSHADLGETGQKTGFWLEEFASPYYVIQDAGLDLVLASPAGGQPPVAPNSDTEEAQTEATRRFKQDGEAQRALAHTRKLSELADEEFDGVFYPGGHGPLWDLANDRDSIALIERQHARGRPLALVCHAPGVLRDARKADGTSIIEGRSITGFTNSEEAAAGLTEVVPFLVEDMLRECGGHYSRGEDWQEHVVTDGALITGQNPASSAGAAVVLLQQLWL